MERVAVIMCSWKRIEKLKQTIDLLDRQTNQNFQFYIWNNNINIQNQINEIIAPYYHWIQIHHSNKNMGGIGRFYYAKKIANNHKKIIFIDDDQIFKSTFINDMLKEYEDNTIKSWFTWKFTQRNYWHGRIRITDGSEGHYTGTGGMILPSSIFKDKKLFNIPKEYLFVEDLWLSWFANHIKGWKLKSTKNVWLEIQVDNKDQYVGLKRTKQDLLNYLITEKNWQILK